ncbi:MAG: hypothetical protein ACREEM_20320 [Blastocatellia bacterium]
MIDDELIGVTVWRLRPPTSRDNRRTPRRLIETPVAAAGQPAAQAGQLLAERANSDEIFTEEQLLQLDIEAPRNRGNHLYVIEREVYADGSMSAPELIFPTRQTPPGDRLIHAGKSACVPSPNRAFRLQLSRKDQIREQITIIVSPEPLNLQLGEGPRQLDRAEAAQMALWEKEWAGGPERYEARDQAGKPMTIAEKEAGEGKRKLVPTDPLPQTIYRVKAGAGKAVLVNVSLQVAWE